jgi:DNA-binding transcriptional MerR regulator
MLARVWSWFSPRRWIHRVRSLREAVGHVRELLALQRQLQAEVREMHHAGLLAAVHLIEQQRRVLEELAEDHARLDERLRALERQIAAVAPASTTAGAERTAA